MSTEGKFPPATRRQWRGAPVAAVLRKSGVAVADTDAPEPALCTTPVDGKSIEPLYAADVPRGLRTRPQVG